MQADDDTDPDDRPTGSERKAIRDQRLLFCMGDELPGAAAGSSQELPSRRTEPLLSGRLCASFVGFVRFVVEIVAARL